MISLSEFVGYFIHGYSPALAMAALNAKVKDFDVDITVVASDFSDYRDFNSHEVIGKRLLVMADNAERPFVITFPCTNENGEEISFANCNLKKLSSAHVTGLEAYINCQRNQISFRAKKITG